MLADDEVVDLFVLLIRQRVAESREYLRKQGAPTAGANGCDPGWHLRRLMEPLDYELPEELPRRIVDKFREVTRAAEDAERTREWGAQDTQRVKDRQDDINRRAKRRAMEDRKEGRTT